jgi:hypothetical protein
LDNTALKRLRIGFLLLGVLLLSPLVFVLRAAEARLEQQRRLRHEIVAERIFDEMERELSTLLESERFRPSSAYSAANTNVGSWSPFVVGYFVHSQDRGTLLAGASQLDSARTARIEGALRSLFRSKDAPRLPRIRPRAGLVPLEANEQAVAPDMDSLQRHEGGGAATNQEDVLRQLNRARKHESAPRKPSADPNRQDDPLMGL